MIDSRHAVGTPNLVCDRYPRQVVGRGDTCYHSFLKTAAEWKAPVGGAGKLNDGKTKIKGDPACPQLLCWSLRPIKIEEPRRESNSFVWGSYASPGGVIRATWARYTNKKIKNEATYRYVVVEHQSEKVFHYFSMSYVQQQQYNSSIYGASSNSKNKTKRQQYSIYSLGIKDQDETVFSISKHVLQQ